MNVTDLRPLAAAATLVALLVTPAHATWSIVAVDQATGEIGVAGATCVNNIDLKRFLPAVRVGKGAGVTQAFVNSTAANKMIIFNELANDTPPAQILALIQAADPGFQSRQIGIVNFAGEKVTFTGNNAQQWKGGVNGVAGTLHYSIQGNVLTGAAVVTRAQLALVNTPGDLASRLMAAMETARAFGGDGRCSCSPSQPTSCGAPPPGTWKSAHVGFMLLARMGDTDGVCTGALGCGNGTYYMDLNVSGNQFANADPVLQLKAMFGAWRTTWLGRPDHLKTTVARSASVLPNDGSSSGTLTINPVDWTGSPLGLSGLVVGATPTAGSAGAVTLGATVDHGNGVYSIPYTATTTAGLDRLVVVIDDGQGPVTLWPPAEVATAPRALLSSPSSPLSSGNGDDVQLALAGGPGLAARSYVVLFSASGTQPGFGVGAVTVPLVLDPVVPLSFAFCGSAALPGTCGVLDAAGQAAAQALLAPNDIAPLVGGTLSFAAITLDPIDFASDAVVVSVVP